MTTKFIPAVTVACCNECPHYDEAEFDSSKAWCMHPSHNIRSAGVELVREFDPEELEYENDIPIPSWCPLADASTTKQERS